MRANDLHKNMLKTVNQILVSQLQAEQLIVAQRSSTISNIKESSLKNPSKTNLDT